MWRDTHEKLPIDERRSYAAGMSGGARAATGVALACRDCLAGVIANAATFPGASTPPKGMKFAYFAAVGDQDFNFPEFVGLRGKLEESKAPYKIRVFEGPHDWAPADVWLESLNWMDLQAMTAGTLTPDQNRIQKSLAESMDRAQKLRGNGAVLESA